MAMRFFNVTVFMSTSMQIFAIALSYTYFKYVNQLTSYKV